MEFILLATTFLITIRPTTIPTWITKSKRKFSKKETGFVVEKGNIVFALRLNGAFSNCDQ
jgi:hypothetical protein